MTTFDDLPPCSPVLEIDEEIDAIHGLMDMSLDYLFDHYKEFNDYILFMIISHHDACYAITPENEGEFLRFADWLDDIYSQLKKSRATGSNVFRLTYDQLIEEYPDLKR